MFKPITTRELTENPWIRLVYVNSETGEETVKEFNLQKFIQRYSSLAEQYMHHGKYSVIGKFYDKLIWTFQIKTACTDGIRLFINPLFLKDLMDTCEADTLKRAMELQKKGINWKSPDNPANFDVKFEAAKYFYFIIMHECYHMIYRHVEQAKRKQETQNGGEYIHWLANTSMDMEINRDIEKQWTEFKGTTVAIDGWLQEKYGNDVWTTIFDKRYAAGEQMPDNDKPIIPTQRLNPPGGGSPQPQNGDDNKREYEAAQDYVDGWKKALDDYKAGKLDPRNYTPLPVDKSKFSHQVLGFLNMVQESSSVPAQNGGVNQDEWNQGYNDAVIAIINAMNAQGGGGGGGDVKITNLPQPPSFGGGDGESDDNQDGDQSQQQKNNQNQNGGGGAANSSQEIDKMSGQQAADSAQQSANNAKQAANQAQQAADSAQQKANQSGSQADQQAADNAQAAANAAQSAADTAQKAANDAKNAAGNGNDDAAKQKAKDAANAANRAQQAANQAKQQASQGSGSGASKKPITNSKDLGDDKSGKGQQNKGAANSSQDIDKMSGSDAANSAQQSANNAQQSANNAKQQAGQSGSSADQKAADNAQAAADAAQKAADEAKSAASNGDDSTARQKAKEAANAANQAQQAANQVSQNGQQSQQSGQQGQQAGQQGQQNDQQGQNQNGNNQQNGQQQGDNPWANDETPTYKVSAGSKWKDQGSDLISTEEGCKIMENEGEDISREINKTPEDHIKAKMQELGKKLAEVGKSAGRGYTMAERLAEIAKSLESPKIKWRRLLLRHFKNLGLKPEDEYKRKISRTEEYRDDWSEKVVPYKLELEARNSADIFYLVDASGSISDKDLQIVFRELIGLEVKEDLDIRKSAFVYFSDNFDESRIRVWYKETDDKEKMRMVKYVSGKDAYGGTDISGSIVHVTQLKKSKNRAMRDLYSRTDPQTLIICFTDGCEGGSFSQVGALPRSIRDKIVFVILNTESESWGFNSVVPQIIQSAKVAPKNIVCIDTQKDLVR